MLRRVQLEFNKISRNSPNIFWAYNFYSSLIQRLDNEYGDILHDSGLKPISHYLECPYNSDKFIWTVNIIGKEANSYLLPLFCEDSKFRIDNHGVILESNRIETVESYTEKEYTSLYLTKKSPERYITIHTITPTSFKSDGEYVMFPTAQLIIKSAIQKWNAYSSEIEIEDPEAVEQIIQSVSIHSYKLRSFKYHIKGVKISSFDGEMTIRVNGAEPLVRLVNMLLNYLEFSGLGIKCALGMGGVRIRKGK